MSIQLVDPQPNERHRAIGVAPVSGLERPRDEVDGVERAEAEPDVRRDSEIPDSARRDLADVERRAVMAERGKQLVGLDRLAAREQGPRTDSRRAFENEGVELRMRARSPTPGQ